MYIYIYIHTHACIYIHVIPTSFALRCFGAGSVLCTIIRITWSYWLALFEWAKIQSIFRTEMLRGRISQWYNLWSCSFVCLCTWTSCCLAIASLFMIAASTNTNVFAMLFTWHVSWHVLLETSPLASKIWPMYEYSNRMKVHARHWLALFEWSQVDIPVSVKSHSFCTSRCPATQQQKLLSSPWIGIVQADFPRGLLLQRSILFKDTQVLHVYALTCLFKHFHVCSNTSSSSRGYTYIYIYIYICTYMYTHIIIYTWYTYACIHI